MNLEEIYTAYFGDVYRYLLKLSGNQQTAEDITAETFLIRDGRVLAAAVREIDVRKAGFERFVARSADQSPFAYGLAAVFLSVGLGWLAGWAARRF